MLQQSRFASKSTLCSCRSMLQCLNGAALCKCCRAWQLRQNQQGHAADGQAESQGCSTQSLQRMGKLKAWLKASAARQVLRPHADVGLSGKIWVPLIVAALQVAVTSVLPGAAGLRQEAAAAAPATSCLCTTRRSPSNRNGPQCRVTGGHTLNLPSTLQSWRVSSTRCVTAAEVMNQLVSAGRCSSIA